MPQKHTGRVVAILIVLWLAVSAVYPLVPGSFFWFFKLGQETSYEMNLKPGIDMVGGTSLLYEIKAPPEMAANAKLSEQVMEALKRRVDPEGVRNLIWRPQGATRLEIQMPMGKQSAQAAEARQEYTAAREQLAATDVRVAEVTNAVENLSGDARAQRLDELAMGSQARQELFGALRSVYDQIKAASEAKNARLQAEKETEYDQLKQQIDKTNLSVAEMEAILSAKPEVRDAKLAEWRKQFAGFDARLKAMDRFEKAYVAFDSVKNALDDAGELKRLLRGSGVLEFHILVSESADPEVQAMKRRLHEKGPAPQAGDRMRWFLVDRPEDMRGDWLEEYPQGSGRYYALAWTTPDKSMVNRPGTNRWALEAAYPTSDQWGLNAVGFRFDAQGAKYFSELTGANVKQMLAVMLDDKIISAANINEQISREGQISRESGYPPEEFRYLISTLSAGSLPAQLAEEPISERTIEPQLGSENLRAGFISCVLGLGMVALFLIGYYYLSGLVAFFAVLLNLVLILGSMAAFNATFTLAGVAGIVLTIGAAVDANVLIFERLREEQMRGLSLRMAIRNAYDRAFSAILDSNVTTMITALILYWLGSEEVKGFGLALLIGLVWSLFTSLFVTRTIFDILVDRFGVQRLGSIPMTFPAWDKMLKPNIDWVGKAWIFITASVLVIVAGMVMFAVKAQQGEILDIEFAGGTAVQFELKEPMEKARVEQLLAPFTEGQNAPLAAASVQKLGNSLREYEVITPNAQSAEVRKAILAENALGPYLKVELASTFAQAEQPVDVAEGKDVVVPVKDAQQTLAGQQSQLLPSHVGGVAIVLKDLSPALTANEIKDRIERQRLQPTPGQESQPYRQIEVEALEKNAQGQATTAVVLVSDPNLPYAQDEAKWRDQLAGPMWKLVNDAVNKPPQLQKVSNFGAQVAGGAQRDALLALTLSVVVIMAYIWLRFGNMLYATATVIAMVHDTLMVVAALGLAHLIAGTAFGSALLIEPFRISLTIVAAILTIMGYSMLDTIVVFDRVRENRGKYGHIDRRVINDSINQTLSRTLLTGGTNLFTVAVMYILGGPGIHGFTFVMLVGIVIGTYSSVAIAAPMLLLGAKKAVAEPTAPARKPSVGGAVPRLET